MAQTFAHALADRLDPDGSEAGRYRADPVAWVHERAGDETWSKQREILESLVTHRRTAVKSCHGVGKSFIASRAVGWWLDVHPPGEAFVVSTAPSFPQVRAILWRYVGKMHRKAALPGRVNQTEWLIGNELVGFGRKPADYDEDSFQGIHAPHVLIVVDEACHDEQTDVMTERGWVPWPEVRDDDRLLTMDPITHEARYIAPTRIVRKWYRGTMIRYGGEKGERGANYQVTPDHQMFYTTRKLERAGKPWKRRRADEMSVNSFMKRDVTWTAPDVEKHVIPSCVSAGRYSDTAWPELVVDMDSWLEFLGWWVAEGSVSLHAGAPRTASISQVKDHGVLDRIEELCRLMGIGPVYRHEHEVRIANVAVARELVRFGHRQHERRVPDYVRMASQRQIEIFLTAFAQGDGYARGEQRIMYTSSRALADDLHELVLKLGRSGRCRRRYGAGEARSTMADGRVIVNKHDAWVVTWPGVESMLKYYPHKAREVSYDGMVYCATVPPDHLLLTRRGGYSLWSGNCGIPMTLWTGAEALITNEGCAILAIGNPDNPDTHFAELFGPGSDWNQITISAFDSPNFTDEEVSPALRRELVGRTYVEDAKKNWGETSPLYRSKVLGEFSEDATDGVVPASLVAALRSGDAKLELNEDDDVQLGVDVGAGGDRSVIRERRGDRVGRVWRSKHDDPERLANEVMHAVRETGATRVCVDAIGWGWGTAGHVQAACRAEGRRVEVVRVMVSQASSEPKRFANLKAEMWWRARDACQQATWDLTGLDDQTAADLVAPRYFLNAKGRIQVETKDDVRDRLGRSPDDADALLLAFHDPRTTVTLHRPRDLSRPVLNGRPTRATR